MRVDWDCATVSAAAGLALFRVVQEGLTNTVKYAPGAATEVHIVFARGRSCPIGSRGRLAHPTRRAGSVRGNPDAGSPAAPGLALLTRW